MAVICKYSLERIGNIICDGIDYTLPVSVIATIQNIADQVGAPEYVKTPQFKRKDRPIINADSTRRPARRKATEVSDADWAALTEFKPTIRPKHEGIEESNDIIRKALNKITDKTYDALYPTITQELDNIMAKEEEVPSDDLSKISTTIFTIVSQTAFFSVLYAKLYNNLCAKYPFLRTDAETAFKSLETYVTEIQYSNPEKDYDAFCRNNKDNARRQSVGVFLINLTINHGFIEVSHMIKIMTHIQEYMMSLIDVDGQAEIVDELSEIFGCMYIVGYMHFSKEEVVFNTIKANIKLLAESSPKTHVSLSNKAVFKHMDLNEFKP